MTKMLASLAIIVSALILIPNELHFFLEIRSVCFVLAGAISFALMGSNNSEKIEFFSKGAVTFGWIGFILGTVMILANLEKDPDGIGAAASIALLTVLYGYVIQAICFIIKSSSLMK